MDPHSLIWCHTALLSFLTTETLQGYRQRTLEEHVLAAETLFKTEYRLALSFLPHWMHSIFHFRPQLKSTFSCRFLVDEVVPRNIRPRGLEELVTDRATGGLEPDRDGQKHGNGPMPSLAVGPEP